MVLEKLKVCEDPVTLSKAKFEIGNNRVSSFTINELPFDDDPPLYEVNIRGDVMKDYYKLIENETLFDDEEEQLFFGVVDDLTKYVIEPISQSMKSGVFISEVVVSRLCDTIAIFIAPNAYAFDINYPKGKIRARVDRLQRKWVKFQEIYLLNSSYRYLFDNMEKYYHDLTSKMLTNVKRSLPKKPKGVSDEV